MEFRLLSPIDELYLTMTGGDQSDTQTECKRLFGSRRQLYAAVHEGIYGRFIQSE